MNCHFGVRARFGKRTWKENLSCTIVQCTWKNNKNDFAAVFASDWYFIKLSFIVHCYNNKMSWRVNRNQQLWSGKNIQWQNQKINKQDFLGNHFFCHLNKGSWSIYEAQLFPSTSQSALRAFMFHFMLHGLAVRQLWDNANWYKTAKYKNLTRIQITNTVWKNQIWARHKMRKILQSKSEE